MATDPAGIMLARDDGVIVILDAVPIPTDWQRQIDAICDLAGAPERHETEERKP